MKKVVATSIAALGITSLLAFNAEAATYTVQPGDSYWKIAQDHSLDYASIMQLNGRTSSLIFPGEQLQLPDTSVVQATPATTTSPSMNVSEGDKDLLARLVRAEALGEPYAGKVAVAEVVLNRVLSPSFPDTVSGVIYESGQFSPVTNGSINKPADSDSIRAVEDALASTSLGDGPLYFYNPSIVMRSWLGSRPTVEVIGHHIFKK